MDRKRLLSPMKQQSFVLLHCRVGHTVRLERADAVQTGAALATRLVAALVAAPCELIGNLQPQTFGNDLRLVPTHERSLDADITARAEYDGVVHRIYEFLAAVGIGIAGGIVVMGSEGNGISSGTARCVTRRLFIPPYPGAAPTSESLNVAMATAVVAAEFRRRIR